ncbi:hypothetical protein [Actinoplanes subtropicus]|uniref:hypothetical protein n=1 Tax=Actinoplanes subtropicus TaxID=543632 RepID=UPI00147030EC|nr:hypothetical protein [Actinoplanes subtropicus]
MLWSGVCVGDAGRPEPGGAYDLGVELLEAAYRSEVSNYLDPAKFSERLTQLTQRRLDDVRAFPRDLRAGSLRDRADRRLP